MAPRITGNLSIGGPAPVPSRVSKLQAELQLHLLGELTSVESLIEQAAQAGDPGMRIYWRSTSHIERSHFALAAIAYEKGWSPAYVDELFVQAAQLG